MSWLTRIFTTAAEPETLDFVPVASAPDWREEKLKEAAKRHGRPFKCAADGLPRETTKDGIRTIVGVTNIHPIKRSKV